MTLFLLLFTTFSDNGIYFHASIMVYFHVSSLYIADIKRLSIKLKWWRYNIVHCQC